jgi:hypothetical protein
MTRDDKDDWQKERHQDEGEGFPSRYTVGDGWKTSKCSEADLKRLVDECFL